MIADDFRDQLWDYAILFGWLSLPAIAIAGWAWRRFRAGLKAPLTPYTAGLSHVWEEVFTFWSMTGLATAILSILCVALWWVVR
jgi:hypothetical protein